LPVVDAFTFPPTPPTSNAPDEVNISPYPMMRARASFDITYTKTPGTARRVRPSTDDPLSPLNWAGKMWDATNSGSFSVAYDDGTFSASGTFGSGSPANFGEMGTERNGFFVHHEEQDGNDDVEAGAQPSSLPLQPAPMSQSAATANTNQPVHYALLKGRVPVKVSY
jgi:hypothetical protein